MKVKIIKNGLNRKVKELDPLGAMTDRDVRSDIRTCIST